MLYRSRISSLQRPAVASDSLGLGNIKNLLLSGPRRSRSPVWCPVKSRAQENPSIPYCCDDPLNLGSTRPTPSAAGAGGRVCGRRRAPWATPTTTRCARASLRRWNANSSGGGPSGRRAKPAGRCSGSSRPGTIPIGGIQASATSPRSTSKPGREGRRREDWAMSRPAASAALFDSPIGGAETLDLSEWTSSETTTTLNCPPKRGKPSQPPARRLPPPLPLPRFATRPRGHRLRSLTLSLVQRPSLPQSSSGPSASATLVRPFPFRIAMPSTNVDSGSFPIPPPTPPTRMLTTAWPNSYVLTATPTEPTSPQGPIR